MLARAGGAARGTRDLAFDLATDAYGPGAAAWLLWKHRHRIRQNGGAVAFDHPNDRRLPYYFRVLLACLLRRPKRWEVVELKVNDGKVTRYGIRWLQFGTFKPRQGKRNLKDSRARWLRGQR